MGKLLFLLLNFRENVQITSIGSIYKKAEKYFHKSVIPQKIAWKGNVGGNEALRVNLLSDARLGPAQAWRDDKMIKTSHRFMLCNVKVVLDCF